MFRIKNFVQVKHFFFEIIFVIFEIFGIFEMPGFEIFVIVRTRI